MRNHGQTDTNHDEQQREHTGLRTLDRHASAQQVYWAMGCQYAGVHVLRQKEHQQADASTQHAREIDGTAGGEATAGGDRSGERGVGL